MSLRILLADESTSIKKAFQLALSDLGADIKSVPSGLDVLTVAIDYQPTVIFADILLTKKSGYEICREIKENPKTKHIPVVLMWSQFMEFNQALAEKAGFDDRLEKPFDTETLRKIILRFYNEAETHPLKNKLIIPEVYDADEDFQPVQLKSNFYNTDEHNSSSTPSAFNFGLGSEPEPHRNTPDVYLETESYGDFEEVVLVKSQNKNDPQQKIIPNISQNISQTISSNISQGLSHGLTQNQNSQLNENLIREEVRVMTEKICWQIIPDMAEKIIKEEIQKLMNNIEKTL